MAGKGMGIILPLTLITVGAALLLQQLGLIKVNVLRFWPVLLIVWGAGMIFTSRRGG